LIRTRRRPELVGPAIHPVVAETCQPAAVERTNEHRAARQAYLRLAAVAGITTVAGITAVAGLTDVARAVDVVATDTDTGAAEIVLGRRLRPGPAG